MEIILLIGYVPLVFWLLSQSLLLAKYDKLNKEQQETINKLKPFQVRPFGVGKFLNNSCIKVFKKCVLNLSNVSGKVYNRSMKKRKPPLNKVAQATRNAHSAELFRSLLLNKHIVATPATRKGSRKSNITNAIKEYN